MLISYRGEFGERDPWQTRAAASPSRAGRARHPAHAPGRRRPGRGARAQGADAGALGQQAGRAAAVPRPDVGGAALMRQLPRERCCATTRCRPSTRTSSECVVVTIMGAVAAELQSHRPPAELLLPAARHGAGLVDGPGHRAGAAGAAGDRARRRRLGADEPGRPDHAGALSAANLVHVVFDNESLLSVGGFPTATSTGSDLAGIAAAAGMPRTGDAFDTLDDFTHRVRRGAGGRRADHARRQGRSGRPAGVPDRSAAAGEPLSVRAHVTTARARARKLMTQQPMLRAQGRTRHADQPATARRGARRRALKVVDLTQPLGPGRR